MELAPIVLFVFNRPSHTRRTLQALEANTWAEQSILHIFADGPRENFNSEQLSQTAAVGELIRLDWNFKEIYIHKKDRNWGLADSIIDGVTRVVNEYGRVIVLEDDIITSPGFLRYMNDALNVYEMNEKVMHISAYMFPIEGKLPPTFFYNSGSCWGWATWSRAWQHFDSDATHLLDQIGKNNLISRFNIEETYPFIDHLKANANGDMKTWAVKWYASFFLRGGHALHPYPSFVNNIGHDGAGENCGSTRLFDWDHLATNINIQKMPIEESALARSKVREFNIKLGDGSSSKQPAKNKHWFKRLRKKAKLKLKEIFWALLRF